jgi:Mn2+/Fe2+ NRAMP family transporter
MCVCVCVCVCECVCVCLCVCVCVCVCVCMCVCAPMASTAAVPVRVMRSPQDSSGYFSAIGFSRACYGSMVLPWSYYGVSMVSV